MTRSYRRWAGWIVVGVVSLDWFSKFLVLNWIQLHERVAVLEGWFYLVRTQNRGVAFGILNESGAVWRTPVLISMAVIAVVFLVRFAMLATDARTRIGTTLVLGGAIGNLGERILHGGVTDFLLVSYFPFIFNVADVAVVGGAIVLASSLAWQRAEPA